MKGLFQREKLRDLESSRLAKRIHDIALAISEFNIAILLELKILQSNPHSY